MDSEGARLSGIGFFEIKMATQDQYIRLKQKLLMVCMISEPSVDTDYIYLESLGKGSQASVDLYRSKRSLENSLS